MPVENPVPDAILRLSEVIRISGLARATVYKRMAAGEFPSAVQLTPRSVGWRNSEVQRWIQKLPSTRAEAL